MVGAKREKCAGFDAYRLAMNAVLKIPGRGSV